MKYFSFLVIIILLPFSSKTFAYTPKEGSINATFGTFFYKTNYAGSTTGETSPWLGDLGLLATGDVSDHGSLEVDIFHMNKIFFRDQDSQFLAEQTQLIHLSMGYRRWLAPSFSISGAIFSEYTLGDPSTVHTDFYYAQPTSTPFQTSANEITLYGFDLSAEVELWSHNQMAVVWNGRYSYGFNKKPNEHSDVYGFLIGARFFIQEKQHAPVKDNPLKSY